MTRADNTDKATRNAAPAIVAVVDDDAAVRDSVALMLDSVGVVTLCYASALEFLADPAARKAGCLILDVRMPGISGIELQRRLLDEHWDLPLIFVTGHGEVGMAVEVMKRGAVEFLQKPFRDQALIDAVQVAIARRRENVALGARRAQLAALLGALTPRERDVFDAVAEGLRTKAIAARLGIATKTAEEYRARVFEKLGVGNAAELATLAVESRLLGRHDGQ